MVGASATGASGSGYSGNSSSRAGSGGGSGSIYKSNSGNNSGGSPSPTQTQNQYSISTKSLLWDTQTIPKRQELLSFLEALAPLESRKLPIIPYTYIERFGSSEPEILETKILKPNTELTFKIEDRNQSLEDTIVLFPSDLPAMLSSIFSLIQVGYYSDTTLKPPSTIIRLQNIKRDKSQTEAEFFSEHKTIFLSAIYELLALLQPETGATQTNFANIQTIPTPSYSELFSSIEDVVLPLLTELKKIDQNESTTLQNREYKIAFNEAIYSLADVKNKLNEIIRLINRDFTSENQRDAQFAKIREKLRSKNFVLKHKDTIQKLKATDAQYKDSLSFIQNFNPEAIKTRQNPTATGQNQELITFNPYRDSFAVFSNLDPFGKPDKFDADVARNLHELLQTIISLSKLEKIDTPVATAQQDTDTDAQGGPEDEEEKLTTAQLLTLEELLALAQKTTLNAIFITFWNSKQLAETIQAWANLPENTDLDLSAIWNWITYQFEANNKNIYQKCVSPFNASQAVNDAISLLVPFYQVNEQKFQVSPYPNSEYQIWLRALESEISPKIQDIFLAETLASLPEFRALQTRPEDQAELNQTPQKELATAGVPTEFKQILFTLQSQGVAPTLENLKKLKPEEYSRLIQTKIENKLYVQMRFAILEQLRKNGFDIKNVEDIPKDITDLLLSDIRIFLASADPDALLRALDDPTSRLQLFSEFSRRFILQQTSSAAFLAKYIALQHDSVQQDTDILLTTTLESYLASPTPAKKQQVMQRLRALLVVTGYTPDKKQELETLNQAQIEALLGISFGNKQLSAQELSQFIRVLQEYTDAYYHRQHFEKTVLLAKVGRDADEVNKQLELEKQNRAAARFISEKNKALLEIGSFFATRLPNEIVIEAKKQGLDPVRIEKLEQLQNDSIGLSKNVDPYTNSISEYAKFVESFITEFLAGSGGAVYFTPEMCAYFLGVSPETISSDTFKKFVSNTLPILQNLLTNYVRIYQLGDATIASVFRQLTTEKVINDTTETDASGKTRKTAYSGMVPLIAPPGSKDTSNKGQQDPKNQAEYEEYVGGLLEEFRKSGIDDRIGFYLKNAKNWEEVDEILAKIEEKEAKESSGTGISAWEIGLSEEDLALLPFGYDPAQQDYLDVTGQTEASLFRKAYGGNQRGRRGRGRESVAAAMARQMNLARQSPTQADKKNSRIKAKTALGKLKKSTKKAVNKKAKRLVNRGLIAAAKLAAELLIKAIIALATKIIIPAAIWAVGKLIALAPFLFKAAFIAGAAAVATTLAVGAAIAIAEGIKWLAQQAWALAQGIWNAGVNILSSIANGIASLFGGGAAIPATTATVAFTTFAAVTLGNDMINDAMYLIPELTDDSLSRYVDIEKTASPSRFDNGEASEIQYTIVISAKDPDNYSVEISNISDRLTMDFLEESTPEFTPLVRTVTNFQPPTFGEPVETAEDTNTVSTESITLDTNNPEITLTYTQPIASTIIDATVINTISLDLIATPISSDGETDSSPISESVSRVEMVCIGDCPQTSEMAWPTSGVITQLPFKYNFLTVDGKIDLNLVKYGTHDTTRNGQRIGADAIDIAAPAGTPIYAPFDAEVLQQLKPYGNTTGVLSFAEAFGPYHIVLSRIPDNVQYVFAHNSSMSVRAGQTVKKCQIIGTVGNYGPLSTGNHLHFERGFEKDGRIFMNLKENDTSILIEEFSTSNLTDTDGNKIDETSYQKRVKSECDQN